jgi:hypothetical protein
VGDDLAGHRGEQDAAPAVPGRVPEVRHVGVLADDGAAIRGARAQPGPAATDRSLGEGGIDARGDLGDLVPAGGRRRGIEPGVLHRGSGNRFGAAAQHVATAGEHDGGGLLGGPIVREDLPADRLDREWPGKAFEPPGPGTGRDHHRTSRADAAGGPGAGDASGLDLDAEGARAARDPDAAPRRTHEQRFERRERLERAVLAREQRAARVRADTGAARRELAGREPFGGEALLALPGGGAARLTLFLLGEGHVQGAVPHEADLHARFLGQHRGELAIEITTANPDAEQRVFRCRLGERDEHPRRGLGGDPRLGAAVEDLDGRAAQGERPRHRGPDDPAANHQHVRGRHRARLVVKPGGPYVRIVL